MTGWLDDDEREGAAGIEEQAQGQREGDGDARKSVHLG